MNRDSDLGILKIGEWRVVRASGELIGATVERLEPKLVDLLFLLATRSGIVVAREELLATLWPGMIVGDDTLARSVSRLRKALGDDPKAPRYIETIAKRGYRCIATVDADVRSAAPAVTPPLDTGRPASFPIPLSPRAALARMPPAWRRFLPPASALSISLLLVLVVSLPAAQILTLSIQSPRPTLIERADDFYVRYTRADNESAIDLYEQALVRDGRDARACAGLANALVQRVLRWPNAPGDGAEYTRLGDALDAGTLDGPVPSATLSRAHALAESAVRTAPGDATAYKALGLVDSAGRDFDGALRAYRTAVALDPDAWGPLINISDVLEITGHEGDAVAYLEAAHAAMTRVYERQKFQVLPWYASLGVLIGDRHRSLGHLLKAEHWYREVLAFAPMQPAATDRLAVLLRESGRGHAADQLCSDQQRRIGRGTQCG